MKPPKRQDCKECAICTSNYVAYPYRPSQYKKFLREQNIIHQTALRRKTANAIHEVAYENCPELVKSPEFLKRRGDILCRTKKDKDV